MRRAWGIAPLLAATVCTAQVAVDVPVRFTGPTGSRGIEGLAPPVEATSVVTLGYAWAGTSHWATARQAADTLVLSMGPAVAGSGEAVLVRFIAPASAHGDLYLRLDALAALPFRRPDGLPIVPGQIAQGGMVEVVAAAGRWLLVSGSKGACPPASLPVNGRFCMGVDDRVGVDYYEAAAHCAALGGKLCSWEEYYTGCVLLGGQLNGMFNGWEWIDDTSNHTHTGDQAGMTSCTDQRSIRPLLAQEARCCFRIRP